MLAFLSLVYFYLYKSIYPLLRTSLTLFYSFLSKKTKASLQLRSSPFNYSQLSQLKNAIWIHASSGEIEYAKEIIRILKSKNEKIVVSYFSISAEKLLKKTSADYLFPLPWENKQTYREIISCLQPKMFLLSRTDFWPILLGTLQMSGVPLHLFAYSHNHTLLSLPWKFLNLSFFNSINTITELDYNQLKNMHLKAKINHLGDPRLDQIFFKQKELPAAFEIFEKLSRNAVIFASTWDEDDDVVFPILKQVLKSNYVFYAPHEINHIPKLERKLKEINVDYHCLSRGENYLKCNFLLIDQVGFISSLYAYCKVAFIGGSFKSKVHNVYESLAWGTPCVVGPFYKNNPEAVMFKNVRIDEKYAVQSVSNSSELLSVLSNSNNFNFQQLRQYVMKNQGASAKIVESFYK